MNIGFVPDNLVILTREKGKFVFLSQAPGLESYRSISEQVRESGSQLLQVKSGLHNKKRTPHLEIKGEWLEQYGFSIGQTVVVYCEFGVITVRAFDIEKLLKQQEDLTS